MIHLPKRPGRLSTFPGGFLIFLLAALVGLRAPLRQRGRDLRRYDLVADLVGLHEGRPHEGTAAHDLLFLGLFPAARQGPVAPALGPVVAALLRREAQALVEELEDRMEAAAADLEFELAADIRDRIRRLQDEYDLSTGVDPEPDGVPVE